MASKVSAFSEDITKQELDNAKTQAIRIMQRDMFEKELDTLNEGKEVKFGPCKKWNLALDSEGIIRCFGRLENLLEPKIKNDPF